MTVPVTEPSVWCIAWRDKTGGTEWCATLRGRRPSDDAVHDETSCGMVVTLRIGSERRRPTCPDCRANVARRKSVPVKHGRKRGTE